MAIIATGSKGQVNASDVNVRTDAGTGYSRVYYAQSGDIVVVQDGKFGTDNIWWLQIKNETRNTTSIGWIRNDFVNPYSGGSGGGTYLGQGTVIGGGPLYCRKQPIAGYEAWGQFQDGTTVQIFSCSTSGWYETRWPATGTSIGYVMSTYISMDGGSTGGGTYLGQGTVIGGGPLYCRKQPIAGYEAWGQFQEGTSVKIYSCSTSGWYETRWPATGTSVGYVMSNYISMSGGTSTTITYNNNAAITYAKNHSCTCSGVCPKHNTSFGGYDTNGCATFVHQCLVAGGLPMFNGWHHSLPGMPSGWNAWNAWTWTYSGYSALSSKGRLAQVTYNNVQAGDIIYTYVATNEPSERYTHVTIAIGAYGYDSSAEDYGVRVCGHTSNQNNAFKRLTASNCMCYRVNSTITVGADERRVSLPASGNGGSYI